MNLEPSNVEELCTRIDELLIILKRVIEDLESVSKSLKEVTTTSSPLTSVPAPSLTPAEQPRTLEDIKMMFPEELEALLSFEDKGEFIMIKPRQFLGSENFAKIASIVRSAGGEYKSAGKDSHFKVPKKT